VPLLQLHGADDGCILPSQVDDCHRFAAPRAGGRPRRRSLPAHRGPRGDRGTDRGLGQVADHATLAARPYLPAVADQSSASGPVSSLSARWSCRSAWRF
jgi:hypothetical protein